MQVINKKIIVIFICLIIFIFGLFKLFNKKEIELDSVKLDIQKQDNTFAIYVEESKAHYEEKDLIPIDGYIFNEEKSQCMNIDGNIINDILSYDYENKKLIVDTTESINCYLYFDKGAGLEIIGKEPKPNGLNLDIKNGDANWTGMYRFQGQQSEGIENYICFGTSDSNVCTKNPSKYMYRIIGIEESGRVKVIKKEALEELDQWWTNDNTSKRWHESLIFEHINNETFLNNTELVPEGWEDKIDNNNWLFGSMNTNTQYGVNQSGVEVYKIESGQKEAIWDEKANEGEMYKEVKAQSSTTSSGKQFYYIRHQEKWNETELPHEKNAKIGLMYVSDYYLSASNDANCLIDNQNYVNVCNTSWIHFSQNNDVNSFLAEYTMTSRSWHVTQGYFLAYIAHNDGYVVNWGMSRFLSVRPVFYLKSNLKLKEGSGTITTPYLLDI